MIHTKKGRDIIIAIKRLVSKVIIGGFFGKVEGVPRTVS